MVIPNNCQNLFTTSRSKALLTLKKPEEPKTKALFYDLPPINITAVIT
jgi:hypothetical protein